jgi:DNA-binding FrmR family transcriptional regulator
MPVSQKNSKKKKLSTTCPHQDHIHPDHSEYLPRLSRVRGQVAGIEKMIGDGRYCVDILIQLRAAMAAVRSVEVSIFEKHMRHCISAAFASKDEKEIEKKVSELTELLSRRTSL